MRLLDQVTKTEKEKEKSKTGYHYSVLLGLDYFDLNFTVIDVMHNLYLIIKGLIRKAALRMTE